jgi:hypothetical protein
LQAQQSQSLQDKEAARRSVEQLAAQQQKLLADLNSDVATQRKSKSARESFLEMHLKEAARKEQQLSKKAAQLVRGAGQRPFCPSSQPECWREAVLAAGNMHAYDAVFMPCNGSRRQCARGGCHAGV